MRAVIWITERSWRRCVDQARAVLPSDAQTILLHASPAEIEEVAAAGPAGLLGRRPPPPPGPPLQAIAREEAEALLSAAGERLGRAAGTAVRRGRVEHEVVAACQDADLLILAREGDRRPGPKSIGRHTRFVVDHAPCAVLLLGPEP